MQWLFVGRKPRFTAGSAVHHLLIELCASFEFGLNDRGGGCGEGGELFGLCDGLQCRVARSKEGVVPFM